MKVHKTYSYSDAYEMYKQGLSLSMVAGQIGVTRQSVFSAFKKRGFKLRTTKPQLYQVYDGKKFTRRPSGYYALTTNDRCLMHRHVWETEVGPIPKGWDIHHIDETKHNNQLSNLECLPKAEHTRRYSPHNNQYTKGRKRASY